MNHSILISALFFTLTGSAFSIDQPLTNITFAAVDIETTGLSWRDDRIIEVSIISFKNTNILNRTSWLINPGIPVPPSSSRIHNITDEMLADKPDFRAVADDILKCFSNSVVVAHNAGFDWNFLKAEFERAGLKAPPSQVMDSIALAKSVFTNQPSFKLSSLAVSLDIPVSPNHRAETDTLTLVYLVQKCLASIGPLKSAGYLAPFMISRPDEPREPSK